MTMTASRRLAAALLVPILVALSGCVKYEASYEVVSEDEIKVVTSMGLDKSSEAAKDQTKESMCEDDGGTSTPTLKNETKEPWEDDTYIGCRVSGTATNTELGEDTQIRLQDDGTWLFHVSGSESEDSSASAEMFDSFKLSVTFPGKVLTHNGSSTVDGRTVTWTDVKDLFGTEGLRATAEDGGGFPMWVVGAVVVLAIAVGGFLFWNNRNKKQQAAAAAAGAMQQWGQSYGQPTHDPYGQQQGWNQQQGYPPQQGGQQQYPPQDGWNQGGPPQGGWNQGGPQQGGWG